MSIRTPGELLVSILYALWELHPSFRGLPLGLTSVEAKYSEYFKKAREQLARSQGSVAHLASCSAVDLVQLSEDS